MVFRAEERDARGEEERRRVSASHDGARDAALEKLKGSSQFSVKNGTTVKGARQGNPLLLRRSSASTNPGELLSRQPVHRLFPRLKGNDLALGKIVEVFHEGVRNTLRADPCRLFFRYETR